MKQQLTNQEILKQFPNGIIDAEMWPSASGYEFSYFDESMARNGGVVSCDIEKPELINWIMENELNTIINPDGSETLIPMAVFLQDHLTPLDLYNFMNNKYTQILN